MFALKYNAMMNFKCGREKLKINYETGKFQWALVPS